MNQEPNPLASAGFMLLAAALVAGCTLLAKMAGTGPDALHALQVSHGRFLFAFIGIATATLILRPRFTRPNWPAHIGRSFFGWGGISLTFAAIQFIPLADATAISFLNPVIAMFLAILILREKAGPWRWFAAAVAILGGVILLRPGSGAIEPGAFIALGAAVLMGTEIIIIKFLTGRERPVQILLINNAIGLTFATTAVLALGVWQMPTPRQWVVLAGIGFMMAVAQTCFIQSMRRADASFASPFFYATLVFAALYDGVIYHTWPDTTSAAGAAIIIAGGALLAWREGRMRRLPG